MNAVFESRMMMMMVSWERDEEEQKCLQNIIIRKIVDGKMTLRTYLQIEDI
jgi:hypothetical protein